MEIDLSAILSEVLRIAPLGLTVIGWYFVNKQANARETRKEHRSLVDNAKKDIIKIAEETADYLTDEKSNLNSSIKWSLDALEDELNRLSSFATSDHFISFINFADACTGDDFEQVDRLCVDKTSPRYMKVFVTRNNLIKALEQFYRNKYLS